MKATLNKEEAKVLEACKNAEGKGVEGEVWFELIERNGLSVNQLKGYISSLLKKGYILQVGFEPTYIIAD